MTLENNFLQGEGADCKDLQAGVEVESIRHQAINHQRNLVTEGKVNRNPVNTRKTQQRGFREVLFVAEFSLGFGWGDVYCTFLQWKEPVDRAMAQDGVCVVREGRWWFPDQEAVVCREASETPGM